jgi:hypothetical protein
MSKNRNKLSVVIDKKINDELENKNYNKSKLINSLLRKWFDSEEKNIKIFRKKGE